MPPKESTKPTSKPSSRGQYSKHRPQLFGKSLDADELDLIFFAYNRYFYERRPLLREEACGIIGVCFGKEPRITDVKDLLDAFDKPENALTRELQGSTDGKVEGLEKVVKTCFNKYLEKDAEAQARAEYLRGL